jgi:hypothetical protein
MAMEELIVSNILYCILIVLTPSLDNEFVQLMMQK